MTSWLTVMSVTLNKPQISLEDVFLSKFKFKSDNLLLSFSLIFQEVQTVNTKYFIHIFQCHSNYHFAIESTNQDVTFPVYKDIHS